MSTSASLTLSCFAESELRVEISHGKRDLLSARSVKVRAFYMQAPIFPARFTASDPLEQPYINIMARWSNHLLLKEHLHIQLDFGRCYYHFHVRDGLFYSEPAYFKNPDNNSEPFPGLKYSLRNSWL